jgi:hypothetical protein
MFENRLPARASTARGEIPKPSTLTRREVQNEPQSAARLSADGWRDVYSGEKLLVE